jgi:hypothetical protein
MHQAELGVTELLMLIHRGNGEIDAIRDLGR